jgi:hypothetical protein
MPKFAPLYSEVIPFISHDQVPLRSSHPHGEPESEMAQEETEVRYPIRVSPTAASASVDFVWFTLATLSLVAILCFVFAALWSFKEIVGIVLLTLVALEKVADIRRRLNE